MALLCCYIIFCFVLLFGNIVGVLTVIIGVRTVLLADDEVQTADIYKPLENHYERYEDIIT